MPMLLLRISISLRLGPSRFQPSLPCTGTQYRIICTGELIQTEIPGNFKLLRCMVLL